MKNFKNFYYENYIPSYGGKLIAESKYIFDLFKSKTWSDIVEEIKKYWALDTSDQQKKSLADAKFATDIQSRLTKIIDYDVNRSEKFGNLTVNELSALDNEYNNDLKQLQSFVNNNCNAKLIKGGSVDRIIYDDTADIKIEYLMSYYKKIPSSSYVLVFKNRERLSENFKLIKILLYNYLIDNSMGKNQAFRMNLSKKFKEFYSKNATLKIEYYNRKIVDKIQKFERRFSKYLTTQKDVLQSKTQSVEANKNDTRAILDEFKTIIDRNKDRYVDYMKTKSADAISYSLLQILNHVIQNARHR